MTHVIMSNLSITIRNFFDYITLGQFASILTGNTIYLQDAINDIFTLQNMHFLSQGFQ